MSAAFLMVIRQGHSSNPLAAKNISDTWLCTAGDLGQDSDSRSLEDEEQKPVLTAAPSRRQVNELSLVPEIDVTELWWRCIRSYVPSCQLTI